MNTTPPARILIALLALAVAAPATAQETLSGTLKTILDRSAIRIGYRADAIPFSFLNPGKQPVGFSVDLCHGIAEDIAASLNQDLLEPTAPAWQKGIRIAYVEVAADQRMPLLLAGAIDLECGSTTANAERAKTAAFSPIFFLAGTKLIVPQNSPITSYRALSDKTVAVSAGTTNAAVMQKLATSLMHPFKITELPSVDAAIQALAAGKADAAASDDILLTGAQAAHPELKLAIIGDYLSYEPYAIMFRQDPPLSALVTTSFTRMATGGTLQGRYNRWFQDKLPNAPALNLPISAPLAEMYRAMGQPD